MIVTDRPRTWGVGTGIAETGLALAAGLVSLAAIVRAIAFFDLSGGGDSFWILVDLSAGATLTGWGVLRTWEDREDGAGYLIQAAGFTWSLAAFTEVGGIGSSAWLPLGSATPEVQLVSHLVARSLMVAAVILLLPDREADGFLRRGPGEAAVAALTAAVAVGLFAQPGEPSLGGTPFGFGNRVWIESAASVPSWVTAAAAVLVAGILLSLHSQRRGLPPTSFQAIAWIIVAASVPLGLPVVGSRLGSPIVDLLAVLVLPALPVVAVIAVLRSAAALGRTVRRLRRAQESMIEAVEEERRRLRQDLHDGIGPALAGVALGIRAVQSKSDDADSRQLLSRLADETENCLEEVRRIIYDLRPPALDQLGLAGAIQTHAQRLCIGEDAPLLEVEIDPMGALPAATELAVFRITAEAVTNAVRHSQSSSLKIELWRESQMLALRVTDNGRGLPANPTVGLGLVSMRQRAEAIGGSLLIGSGPAGGTEVRARLPLPSP